MDRVRFPDPARIAFALVVLAGVLFPTLATASGMAVKSGTYLGNSTDNRSIFVGFQPDVVIIDMDQAVTAAPDDAVIRTSSMAGDRAKSMDGATAPAADRIQSLDVAGFTLGTQATVNGAGITYHWVAFRAAPGTLKVGTYVGDGVTDSRSITGVGFQPEYVIVMPNNTQRVVQRTSDMPPDLTHDFSGLAFVDGIQALEADGFQVGLDATVNASGITYYYAAWSVTPGEVAVGVYTGDGVTNPLNIAGLGFAPEHVIVNRSPGAAGPAGSESVHKMASTGVAVDRALIFDSRLRVANNIKALQADGFQVGLDARVNSGVAPNTYYWVAFGPRAGTTNYRSIGTAATYGTGTINVTAGSTTVTGFGTSWLTANRGRGDVITIPCGDPPACTVPTPGVHYTVAAVSTNLGLQLTQGYAGTTAVGVSYLLRRQFSTLAAWEDCIDGLANGGSCDFFPGAGFPPASDSLVADNRSEVGIAYADAAGADLAGGLDIDGNVANNTDATHTITLTADGGNRHFGRAGQGVLIDNGASLSNAIRVRDDFVTVEWMEIVNGGAGADGITLSGIAATSQVVLRNNLVHGVNADGLDIADDDSKADVYDNIVYNNTGRGIRVSPGILQPGSRYRLLNNTVYGNVQEGFYKTPDISAAATILLRNNISHTNGGDYALDPADSLDSTSRDNLDGDGTGGVPHSPTGGDLSVPLANLRFVSTTLGSENLHIQEGSAAENNAVDLSSIFTTDIDAAVRRTPWDRGADDVPAVVNYRSIGTLGPDTFGTANIAVTGTTIVTGTGGTTWKTDNRGRGDVITIPCPALPCLAGPHYTIQAVTSDNTLVLTTPFAGAPGPYAYAIRRQFATLALWETCIDGGGSSCGLFPSYPTGDLVGQDRSEVGIAYKETPLARVTISGSTTDALHRITLTADPGNRHLGVAGNGVVVDNGLVSSLAAVLVQDDFVTLEWLEVKGGDDEGVEWDVASPGSNQGVARNLLVHNITLEGILLDDADANVDVYNNIVYATDLGIRSGTALVTGTIRVFNNTVYGNTSGGITASGSNPSITLVNNIAHTNGGTDFSVTGLNSSSRNNLAGTTGATGGVSHSPLGGGMDSIALYNLSAPYGVNFVADNVNNAGFDLHLRSSSLAIDQGANLSAVFGTDIDSALRTGTWDIGADEQGATTEVTLEAFSALGLDSAVELSWKTASELRNLGFHLYRSTSASGPWTRITQSLIPGLGSSPIGTSYSFRDAGLTNGTRYWYRLEDVDASGLSTQHGPVSATPVVPRASDAPSPVGRTDSSGLDPKAADGAVRPWGDPSVVDLRILHRTRNHLLVELETRGFYTSTDPSSGLLRVTIPTFEPASDPQGPALPLRRALLDAVVGRRARIASVRSLDLVSFPGLVPQAEGFSEMAVSADGTVRARRRAASLRASQRGLLPEEPAWLRASVFLGDEKKLVLELSPLRFDPRGRRLVLARRLRVLISFGEREPEERGAGVRGRKDPGHQDPISERLLAFIHVAREGLQAVSFEELFPGRPGAIPLRSLKLSRKGVAVPFHVAPRGASFGPGGLLVFHADASVASTSFTEELAYSLSLATDGVRMAEVKATPSTSAAATSWALSRFETNRHYQAGLLDAPEPWLWEALVAGTSKTIGFSLSGVEASSALAARLCVALQGASDVDGVVDHHLRAFVNGVFVGERRFDGKRPVSLDVELAAWLLKEGQNELTLENTGEARVASLVFLDRFSLAYPQAPIARGGQFEGTWAASGTAEIAGFAVPPLGVVEVAGTAARWLHGVEWTGGPLRFRAEAGWRTLAAAADAIPHPRVSFPAPPPWDETTQADYILITPRAFLETARRLVARRESQGLSTLTVSLETIAERFGHGEASAEAIRGFLAHAFHHFAPPSPRYVVLLGGSTYDPRNFFGRSRPSPLPPLVVKTSYLWTVSDPTLAAVNGDDALPDLAIGRLPASTVEEAGVLIDKQLAWEDSGQALDGRAVLVADNPDTGGDFEANQRDIQASFLGGRESELLFLRELGSGTRPAILGAFDAGASLMSYVGHGGAAIWASENVLNSWDAASLLPQSRQPVLLTMNCLNGYFLAATFNSIAEAFLKAEGRGSVAGFSPSGLSLDGPAHLYHRAFVAELVSGRHERLGDALLAAQKAYAETGAMPELLSIYHLLGDPAMTIR